MRMINKLLVMSIHEFVCYIIRLVITSIVVDLSEVLLTGIWGIDKALSKKLGIEQVAVANAVYGSNLDTLLRGEITELSYWHEILRQTQWGITPNELMGYARNNFTEIEGTRGLIRRLHTNYNLGLLSNHAKEWIAFCSSKFGYEKLFNECMYSYEIGICKPDLGIYEAMLTKLGVPASSCLFIDDNPENVSTAENIGFTGIQFSNAGQLEKDLYKLRLLD